MFQVPLAPVSGHPYVLAWSGNTGSGHQIFTQCTACGDRWSRDCNYPDKAPVWVARYCALHCHGNQQLQAQWENMYHTSLQAFNMRHRGY
jgi:hypothetical protein